MTKIEWKKQYSLAREHKSTFFATGQQLPSVSHSVYGLLDKREQCDVPIKTRLRVMKGF